MPGRSRMSSGSGVGFWRASLPDVQESISEISPVLLPILWLSNYSLDPSACMSPGALPYYSDWISGFIFGFNIFGLYWISGLCWICNLMAQVFSVGTCGPYGLDLGHPFILSIFPKTPSLLMQRLLRFWVTLLYPLQLPQTPSILMQRLLSCWVTPLSSPAP